MVPGDGEESDDNGGLEAFRQAALRLVVGCVVALFALHAIGRAITASLPIIHLLEADLFNHADLFIEWETYVILGGLELLNINMDMEN